MNTKIKHYREIALKALKPSSSQLEHGMELHRHSIVIESYGLGLHAPVDANILNSLIESGASKDEIDVERVSMYLTRWVTSPELIEEYQYARDAAGVTCTFQNAGEECNDPVRLLRRLGCHTYVRDMMPDFLQRIVTPEDIVVAHEAGRYATCIATNGVPLPGKQMTVNQELECIRIFANLGVRMMHLTYNRRNPIGDGCAELADAGLSDFGRTVVAEMNRLGIIIDVAHSGWQTCLEAARVSSKPIVISHSAAWELQRHMRCKSDAVIQAVVETGGTMGITNMPDFIGGSGDIIAFLDHIDYVAQKFGVEAVSIGTDDSYRALGFEESEAKILNNFIYRPLWENFWPVEKEIPRIKDNLQNKVNSMAWTNWPLFTVGLVQRGYSDDDIQKIIGGNMLRVAREVWKGCALDKSVTAKMPMTNLASARS